MTSPPWECPEGLRVHTSPTPPGYGSANLATHRNALQRIQDRRSGARNLPRPKAGDGRRPRKVTRRSGMDRIHRMSRGRKTLLSLLLVGALGAVAGIGTFSAFSATTVNAGNTFDAGTVVISDNDANSAMYNITDAKPNDVVVRCIRVTYTGTLPSTVRLYTTHPVERVRTVREPDDRQGHQPGAPFPDCTGFTSEATRSSAGTLGELRGAHTNFGNGSVANPGAQTQWNQNDSARLPVHADAAGQPAAQRADVGRAQLHVGGAERLTPADPGGPRSGPPGPPREAPVQLLPGPGSPDQRRSHPAPSESSEG